MGVGAVGEPPLAAALGEQLHHFGAHDLGPAERRQKASGLADLRPDAHGATVSDLRHRSPQAGGVVSG
jgi:hypothetical protein